VGPATTQHDGEAWSFPTTTSAPKPMQQPHPPLWIAARDPNSHDFAVANGCNVQVTPLALGDEEIESLMQRFNDACANHPEIPRPKIMCLRHTYVGSDEADIQQAAREISVYYNYFGAWFKNEKPVTQGLIERLTEDELAMNPAYSPEVIRKNAVVGTADEVIARLKHCESLGYDEYSMWIDTGMSFERKRESLRRLIEDVMPAFA
jgi:alkanesulfonate monooxygenase SsuD/methylene tetrahydromethanopterin reductase-like flavin-dependent oxidoreductase (luciferase family)